MQKNQHAVNENHASKPLSLKPRLHQNIRDFITAQPQTIFDLIDAFGSPLNLIFPHIMDENIAAFRRIYDAHHLQGRIYISTKPNKSQAAIRQGALNDVGVDVSSESALKMALASGFDADRMECTGPKNLAYLALAIQHGMTINVDNFEELEQIISLRRSIGSKAKTKIFIRLAGFHSPRLKFTPHDGTFGIHVDETDRVFAALKTHEEDLDFQGFSFHFNTNVLEQKIVALENILSKTLEAIKRGFKPKGINIGGGFEIAYAESLADWHHYVNTLKDSLRDYSQSLTWNNGGLGFRNEGGLIKGGANFMAHAQDKTGAADLEDLVSLPLPALDNMTMAQVLSDCLLELYIEPGRAMFDQLGITIGRVSHVKTSMHGETLVNLDMNRSSMNTAQQKLLTDPIILAKDTSPRPAAPNGVYYTGNLCLSYDMITYNKTFPDFCPQAGDLVMFANTAAYIMDFVESRTLHQKLAEKVAVMKDGERYRWFKDDQYNPVILKGESA